MRRAAAAAAPLLLAALVVVPVAELVRGAGEQGLAGVRDALGAPGAGTAILHTLAVALLVTVLAVAAGTAFAVAVERRPPGTRRVLRLLLAGPLLVPEFVLGFAWGQAYGPAGLGDQLAGVALPGLFGPAGIVLVLTVHGLPLAYLAVTAGLAARADPDLEAAARIAGARPWTTLRTITLPLLRVPLLAAGVLVFVSAVGSFAVPQVLGTPAGFATMSTLVYADLALSADPASFTDLTVLALAMLVLVLVVVGVADGWLGAFRPATPRPATGATRPAGSRAGTALLAVAAGGYLLFGVAVPLLVVVLTALTTAPGVTPVPAHWTLGHFAGAFRGPAALALLHTTLLAVAAAVLVPLLGGVVALAARGRWRTPLATAVTLAFAVPGSALAVGVTIGYGRWLTGSAAIILLAYLAKFWVLGHRPVQASLDRLPPELTLAARASGAGPGTALRTVVLPPLRVAVLTAAGLTLLFASHELTMSSILYGPGSETFAVVILNQRDLGDVGATAALALVLTAPVLLACGLVLLLRRRGTPA
ncbi:MAG TPA: ABC transporter permease subunit [Rugosimonospora sp.]|nr:ABC transporter permease subunit [Rugosimonospora sp.]